MDDAGPSANYSANARIDAENAAAVGSSSALIAPIRRIRSAMIAHHTSPRAPSRRLAQPVLLLVTLFLSAAAARAQADDSMVDVGGYRLHFHVFKAADYLSFLKPTEAMTLLHETPS